MIDHLGVKRMVLAGHSMGGRLVTEPAAAQPDRVIGLILLDAIVGDTWDRMVYLYRFFPPLMVGTVGTLVVDTVTTVPWFGDPRQALKLGRLVAPTIRGHLRQPWRMLGPAASILRSRGSRRMLERLRGAQGAGVRRARRLGSRRAAADRQGRRPPSGGDLVVVQREATWRLKDPETMPGILHTLMRGRLGTAVLKAQLDAGVDPVDATDDEVEAALYEPDALVLELTPRQRHHDTEDLHRAPRYRWKLLAARPRRLTAGRGAKLRRYTRWRGSRRRSAREALRLSAATDQWSDVRPARTNTRCSVSLNRTKRTTSSCSSSGAPRTVATPMRAISSASQA